MPNIPTNLQGNTAMETNKAIITGRYEALALCLDNPEMAECCINAFIEEMVKAGFEHKKAKEIEHENIRAYFKRFDDKRALQKISNLLEQGAK